MDEIFEECNIETPKQKELANKLMNFVSKHKFFKEHKGEILHEKLRSLFDGLVFLNIFDEKKVQILLKKIKLKNFSWINKKHFSKIALTILKKSCLSKKANAIV